VGSSNLNIASWLGNYELDAVVENTAFAGALEKMYEEDLAHTTEIVLHPSRTLRLRHAKTGRRLSRHAVGLSRSGGSASRAAAGAMRIGRTVGAALTGQRVLATAEALIVAVFGVVLLAFAVIALLWPMVVVVPLSILGAWMAIALLGRAYALRRQRRAREASAARL
jgi:cardiolipin synthase